MSSGPHPVRVSESEKTRRQKQRTSYKFADSGLLKISAGGVTFSIKLAAAGAVLVGAFQFFPDNSQYDAELGKMSAKVEAVNKKLDEMNGQWISTTAKAEAERTVLQLRLADLAKQCQTE